MTILVTPVDGTLALDVVEEADFRLLLLNQFDPLPTPHRLAILLPSACGFEPMLAHGVAEGLSIHPELVASLFEPIDVRFSQFRVRDAVLD